MRTRMERGDRVTLTLGGETVEGMVTLASPNGESLIVMFDGVLPGRRADGSMTLYPGAIALRWDADAQVFREIFADNEVKLVLQLGLGEPGVPGRPH